MTSIEIAANQAADHGFAPIRINRRTKLPVQRAWQTNAFIRDDFIAFSDDDNLGIATGYNGLVAIDVDEGGEFALEIVRKHLGEPLRRMGRSNAPHREKWLYRQHVPELPIELIEAAHNHQAHANSYKGDKWLKDKLETYKPFDELRRRFIREHGLIKTESFKDQTGLQSFEIKSFGAQIVIPPSIHHSGATVEWLDAEGMPTPEEWEAATPITAAMIKALRFEVTGSEEPEARDREEWTGDAVDVRLAISALNAIPNGPEVPYDTYRNIAFSLNAIGPESDALFQAFENWAVTYPEHKAGDSEMLWEAANPDGGIGPGTLFYLAKGAGWDRRKAEFHIIEENIRSAEGDRDALKSFYAAIAGLTDETDRTSLIKMVANRLNEIDGANYTGSIKKQVEHLRRQKASEIALRRKELTPSSCYPEILKTGDGGGSILERPDPYSQKNVIHLIAERAGYLLYRDGFQQEVYYVERDGSGKPKPIDKELSDRLYDMAHRDDFRIQLSFLNSQIDAIATRDKRDPVREFLSRLPMWDGVPRLATAFQRLMGAPDSPSVREVLPLVMMAMIRRTFKPGYKFDLMPILEGRQGLGKSSFFRLLMPVESWFGGGLKMNEEPKRLLSRLGGKLVIEFGELVGMSKQNINAVKSLISEPIDEYTPNHALKPIRAPRRCIFVGTVNDRQYLRDLDENRRFPIIPVTKELDYSELKAEREQLWAEAMFEETLAGDLRLSEEAVEDMRQIQSARYDVHPEAQELIDEMRNIGCGWLTTGTIWDRLGVASPDRKLRSGPIKHTYDDVKKSLEREGWDFDAYVKINGKAKRVVRKGGASEANQNEILCHGGTMMLAAEAEAMLKAEEVRAKAETERLRSAVT